SPHRSGGRSVSGQAAEPVLMGFSELVSAALRSLFLQRNGAADSSGLAVQCRPMAGRSRLPLLGGQSYRVAGAHSVARAPRASASRLHTLHSSGSTDRCAPLAAGAACRFSVLCFPDRTRIFGLLSWIPAGAGARTAISAPAPAT